MMGNNEENKKAIDNGKKPLATSKKEKPQRSHRLTIKQKRTITGLCFISPWVIGFLTLVIYPLLKTIYMSFYTVYYGSRSGWKYTWVGLENFKRILFEDVDFVVEAQNFLLSVMLYVPVIIALSVIIAMLLNQKLKGIAFFRLVFFLPIIILNGELLKNMSDNGGMAISVNKFILDVIIMIAPSEAIANLIVSIFTIVVELLWYSGVPILIFLAALQKINTSIYEAAAIDGASAWTTFWKITLPTIYPLVSVIVIYLVVFLAGFDGNPINKIILESKYDASRRDGYASALSILYSFLQVGLIGVLYLITRYKKSESGVA